MFHRIVIIALSLAALAAAFLWIITPRLRSSWSMGEKDGFSLSAVGLVPQTDSVGFYASYSGPRNAATARATGGKLSIVLSVGDDTPGPPGFTSYEVGSLSASRMYWPIPLPTGERPPPGTVSNSTFRFYSPQVKYTLQTPLWLPPILFAAYPMVAGFVGLRRRRRRRRLGRCVRCGYDLTGNESGKCPECGKAT